MRINFFQFQTQIFCQIKNQVFCGFANSCVKLGEYFLYHYRIEMDLSDQGFFGLIIISLEKLEIN